MPCSMTQVPPWQWEAVWPVAMGMANFSECSQLVEAHYFSTELWRLKGSQNFCEGSQKMVSLHRLSWWVYTSGSLPGHMHRRDGASSIIDLRTDPTALTCLSHSSSTPLENIGLLSFWLIFSFFFAFFLPTITWRACVYHALFTIHWSPVLS